MKLWQKRITSLSLFPFGIEIRSALAAAHGEGGEAVLEDLLEREELQDAEGDGRMEAEAALVRPDGAVHLNAEAAVDVDLPLVVHPRDAEHDDAFRLHHALEDLGAAVLRVTLEHEFQGLRDLFDGLMEFRLAGVFCLDLCDQGTDVL